MRTLDTLTKDEIIELLLVVLVKKENYRDGFGDFKTILNETVGCIPVYDEEIETVMYLQVSIGFVRTYNDYPIFPIKTIEWFLSKGFEVGKLKLKE